MTPRERAEKIAILIGREVAELPDRTSPPDEPTLLLVTEQELREILEPHLERAITDHLASLAAEQDVEGKDAMAIGKELYCILQGCFEDWDALAGHAQKSWKDVGSHVLAHTAAAVAKAREDDELAALAATLPEGYIWGDDAMKQFRFGKKCAADAIRALQAPHEE